MAANKIVGSIGHHGHWGFSAGFDMLDLLPIAEADCENIDSTKPLNILLVEPGDIRHILFTIARRRRHCKGTSAPQPINFYVLEQPLDLIARELLLLQVLCDFELPIRQRANTFLEIFGNNLVQERTYRYIGSIAEQLHKLIMKKSTNLDGNGSDNDADMSSLFTDNLIDLSCLRFKEIDELSSIFHTRYNTAPAGGKRGKAAQNADDNDNESGKTQAQAAKLGTPAAPTTSTATNTMVALRDQRQRGHYAERYDSRVALTDWDFHHHVKPTIAGIVHVKLFREWRVNGTAFEFGDQVYTHNNNTMLTFVEGTMKKGNNKGEKKEVIGFWGDIVSSPYFSFGIDDADRSTNLSTIKAAGEGAGAAVSAQPKSVKYTDGLWEILNKDSGTEQHRHHAVEIAVYNILSLLYEVESGKKYTLQKENDIYSGLGSIDNLDGKSASSSSSSAASKKLQEEEEAKAKEEKSDVLDTIKEDCDEEDEEEGAAAAVANSSEPAPAASTRTAEEMEALRAAREEEAEQAAMLAMLRKAETIVESLDGVKIFPICGGITMAEALTNAKKGNFYTNNVVEEKSAAAAGAEAPPAPPVEVKSKFRNQFDFVFVGSRAAQIVKEDYFADLLRATKPTEGAAAASTKSPRGVVCVENSKYLVPLSSKEKVAFDNKIVEFATGIRAPPTTPEDPAAPPLPPPKPGKFNHVAYDASSSASADSGGYPIPRRFRLDADKGKAASKATMAAKKLGINNKETGEGEGVDVMVFVTK